MEKPPASAQSISSFWQQLRKPLELEVARGCPDSAIVGVSIGEYARRWAERYNGNIDEDQRLALSIARGLRDYAKMPEAERNRRAMAAIDLLRGREALAAPPPPAKVPLPRKVVPPPQSTQQAKPNSPPTPPLPVGHELLEMPVAQLAPRARWPRLLAEKLDIYTVRDLLYHIPRDWVEVYRLRDLPDGARAALVGTVARREYERLKSKQSPHPLYKYMLTLRDEQVEAWITSITIEPERPRNGKRSWSPAKLPFLPGQQIFAMGKVERTGKLIELRMEDVALLTPEEANEVQPGSKVPLYPLTSGVYQNQMHRAVLRVLAALGSGESSNASVDPLPQEIREQYGLLPLVEALQELHRPHNELRHEQARKRLAFEEFLVPQLLLARRRWEQRHQYQAPAFSARESLPELVSQLVQFQPTPSQLRVLAEIEEDLRSPRPMNRMLQGDVGSGKTLIAAGAVAYAVRSGTQAAVMAPTEILAEQLYLVLSHTLMPLGITPRLLTGSVTGTERRETLAALADGSVPVAVGTQALIQEGVLFRKLGLVIIDEQHRFGVLQRATLRGKGEACHTLAMTATPIPRTLSLTAYGDLDLSVLDGLPPGRHPIETRWLPAHDMREGYEFIRAQVKQGRQAYVLCPLVEESEMLQAEAAIDMAARLQKQVFPELKIGLLHGRLSTEEKEAAMEAFRTGQTHILACTTVVEVGVDVPNATVMLINNAERFGLAQLHQLRGRVGRSEHQSYCLLATHPRYNPEVDELEDTPARRRLRIMLDTQDGFAIADADLQLRGPGEYLGTRQSGVVDYKIGNMLRDGVYLEQARQAAQAIIADDPDLAAPAYSELRRRVQRMKARLDQFRE